MKKNIKNQKGAISLFVLLSMMFFLAFMLGAFTMVNRRNAAQVEALKEIEKIYGRGASAQDKYDAIFASEDEIIPITNFKELETVKKVCKDADPEKKYLINGRVYTYKSDANYVLQNDIVVVDNEDIETKEDNKDNELLNTFFACADLLDKKINSNNYWVYYEYQTNSGNKKLYEDSIPIKTGDNKLVALNKNKLGTYLSNKIDYVPLGSENGSVESNGYVTSSTYRLFYIDFDNKYGDGKGTIYLKADCTDKNNEIYNLNLSTNTNSRYLQLNPKWNESGKTSLDQNNKQAVAWLLDENNWSNLKDSRFGNDVNYVVGGPTIDLFLDSYNTYLPNNKIVYRYYDENSNKNGYQVAFDPRNNNDYSYCLWDKLDDENIMYSPGKYSALDFKSYWIASPVYDNLDSTNKRVFIIKEKDISSDYCTTTLQGNANKNAICPIASITLTRGYLEVKS